MGGFDMACLLSGRDKRLLVALVWLPAPLFSCGSGEDDAVNSEGEATETDVSEDDDDLILPDVMGGAANLAVPNPCLHLQIEFDESPSEDRSCKFAIPEDDFSLNGDGYLALDGSELIAGDENGWILNSRDEFELLGDACEELMTDAHLIELRLPCPPPIGP